MFLNTYPWTTNFGNRKKVRSMVSISNAFRETFFRNNHRPCLFTCYMCQSTKGVIKMCEITRESMRGGKKLRLDWMHIFGVRLGQNVGLYAWNLNSIYKGWREGILLKDLANWLATKVCIDLENLQQKVGKKKLWKRITHIIR